LSFFQFFENTRKLFFKTRQKAVFLFRNCTSTPAPISSPAVGPSRASVYALPRPLPAPAKNVAVYKKAKKNVFAQGQLNQII
jgi:hypothetical protein